MPKSMWSDPNSEAACDQMIKLAANSSFSKLDMQFQLRRRRLSLGWTVEDLAEAAGMSVKKVQKFESVNYDPKASTIRRIAVALGAEVHYTVKLLDLPAVE